jgi:hypothetical protein
MKKKQKPDNIVFSEEEGYNAKLLPYSTSVGAPAIKMNDIVSWKSRGITNVNKEFENKFNELKKEYLNLMKEYEWNELICNSKFSFEPIIGEQYHLYKTYIRLKMAHFFFHLFHRRSGIKNSLVHSS